MRFLLPILQLLLVALQQDQCNAKQHHIPRGTDAEIQLFDLPETLAAVVIHHGRRAQQDKNNKDGNNDNEDKKDNKNKKKTEFPSNSPSTSPSDSPTHVPTFPPTNRPTSPPTRPPTYPPTISPTNASPPTQPPTSPPVFTISFIKTPQPTHDPTRNPTNVPTLAPTTALAPDSSPKIDPFSPIDFDTTNFVDAERLEPITFNVTVSKFTSLMNGKDLEVYFKVLLEGVLNMRSNAAWYPLHAKSINNITLDLIPLVSTQETIPQEPVPVQLVVNGLVYVHVMEEEKTSRNSFAQTSTQAALSTTETSFRDSFDHSMLLYFTFWGLDDVEKALDEEGGLQNPIIESVGVGRKKLVGIDRDADSLEFENSGSNTMKSRLDVGNESGARGSHCCFFSFLVISTCIMWQYY